MSLYWTKLLLKEMGLGTEICQEKTDEHFAPINIALCKYWGKRDQQKHLPLTQSLSLTVPQLGAWTQIAHASSDTVRVNGELIDNKSQFAQQIFQFLAKIRLADQKLEITTRLNIAHSAGLASSAAGFATLTKALAQFYGWQCSDPILAQIARWGSGSATRSFQKGWVLWPAGIDPLGRDSYGRALPQDEQLSGLGLGVLSDLSFKEKAYSSRTMMADVVASSVLYQAWPKCVERDCAEIRSALKEKALEKLIMVAERNARAMHATLADLPEYYHYETPQSFALKQKIHALRQKGWPVAWTQDAGPQVKLLFPWDEHQKIKQKFPEYQLICPEVC